MAPYENQGYLGIIAIVHAAAAPLRWVSLQESVLVCREKHACLCFIAGRLGKPLVMADGSVRSTVQLVNAFAGLVPLRRHMGCTLPIEVWHTSAEREVVDVFRPAL